MSYKVLPCFNRRSSMVSQIKKKHFSYVSPIWTNERLPRQKKCCFILIWDTMVQEDQTGPYNTQRQSHNHPPHDVIIRPVEEQNELKRDVLAKGASRVPTLEIALEHRQKRPTSRRLNTDLRFIRRVRQGTLFQSHAMASTRMISQRTTLYSGLPTTLSRFLGAVNYSFLRHQRPVFASTGYSACAQDPLPTANTPRSLFGRLCIPIRLRPARKQDVDCLLDCFQRSRSQGLASLWKGRVFAERCCYFLRIRERASEGG